MSTRNRARCRIDDERSSVENKRGTGIRAPAVLSLFLIFMLGTGVGLSAQEGQPEQPSAEIAGPEQTMMESCQAMAAKMKEMKARMAAMDEKLIALTEKMNAVSGEAKTKAIAAVVNETVEQHTSMRGMMMTMQPRMMQHMMGHRGGGMRSGMMRSMENCPMMKMMSESGEASD